MTAEALLSELRARGVTLEAHGDRLKIRPSTLVTLEEVEQLRALKPLILGLLSQQSAAQPTLDKTTTTEVLGRQPAPHALASLQLDVMQAVARLEAEIASGRLAPRPLLVRGRPLGDWLPLDEVARLLLVGKDRR